MPSCATLRARPIPAPAHSVCADGVNLMVGGAHFARMDRASRERFCGSRRRVKPSGFRPKSCRDCQLLRTRPSVPRSGGKTCSFDGRNMDEHILATTRRLDETKTFGRVEPLHSTLSHSVVSAGSKQLTSRRSPHTPACPKRQDTPGCGRLGSSNDSLDFGGKRSISWRIRLFCPFGGH